MYRIIFTVFALLILLPSAHAVECFSPSPSVKKNIDIYEEIQTRDLSTAEYKELLQFFDKLRGSWSGKGEVITCKGDTDHPREEKSGFTVEAKIDKNLAKATELDLNLHFPEKKQSSHETLSYFLTAKRLGLTEIGRAGDVELINIAPNFLVYLRKVNRRTPAGGLVAQEFVKSLAIFDHGLMMEDLNYSNGVLDSKRTMSLKPK